MQVHESQNSPTSGVVNVKWRADPGVVKKATQRDEPSGVHKQHMYLRSYSESYTQVKQAGSGP